MKYSLIFRQNDPKKNEPNYSVSCVEWDLVADDDTLSGAISGLFAAISVLEKEKNLPTKRKTSRKKQCEVTISAFA